MDNTDETPKTPYQRSDAIKDLAAALCKAQGAIQGAAKDSVNPHFRAKYADLASCWESCRSHLTENGLSVVQTPIVEGDRAGVTTLLLHSSGQWIQGDLLMQIAVRPVKDRQGNVVSKGEPDPQTTGSCITYARRYALMAFVGIAPTEDDDGNAASKPEARPTYNQRPAAPKKESPHRATLKALMDKSQGIWSEGDVKKYIFKKHGITWPPVEEKHWLDLISVVESGIDPRDAV